jgi:hypothetical protein
VSTAAVARAVRPVAVAPVVLVVRAGTVPAGSSRVKPVRTAAMEVPAASVVTVASAVPVAPWELVGPAVRLV